MTEYEFILRMSLLVVGFLIMVGAGVLKYFIPKSEVTPIALIGFGALCVITSTNGVR